MNDPAHLADLAYRSGLATWDIGEPQARIRQLVAHGAVRGNVLDPGCGTGWHAIEFARTGCTVTGVDLSPTAIHRARTNARATGAAVSFRTADVTNLPDDVGRFDTVIDSKCLDNLATDDDRRAYLRSLHRVTTPGARLFVFAFGRGDVNGCHNHLVPDLDIENLLPAEGFDITYVGETTYALQIRDWRPLCRSCPKNVPDGRMHIPMLEVHTTRTGVAA